jgi:DNA-binding transcriptional LysR family regulator
MDAAFLRTQMPKIEGLIVHPLHIEPMVVAVPTGHRLARKAAREPVPIKDLAGDVFVVYAREQSPGLYSTTVAACLEAGFTPQLGQEASRVTSALSLVAAGLGVSIVPASMQHMGMGGVVYRVLKSGPQLKVVLQIASRQNETSAVVRNFLNLVRRTARATLDG